MRMDRSRGPTAADLVNAAGGEGAGRRDLPVRRGAALAAHRARDRRRAPADRRRRAQLAAIVRRAVPTRGWQRIDPATRTFQALRIWVNGELDGLDRFVRTRRPGSRAGGRLAVITFHSLEDRIVKHTMRALAATRTRACRRADEEAGGAGDGGARRNPRARSAKLRAARARHGRLKRRGPMEAFEYAIKKDIRNNPIVREVDEARQRELWRSARGRASSWSRAALLRVAALRADPLRLSDRADCSSSVPRRAGRTGTCACSIQTLQPPRSASSSSRATAEAWCSRRARTPSSSSGSSPVDAARAVRRGPAPVRRRVHG